MPAANSNPLCQLIDAGQSFWMDSLSRPLIESGTLARMIKEDGLRGVTSNPDILEKAIAASSQYDAQIRTLAKAGHTVAEIYETLAIGDIQAAADVLKPVYTKSGGVDGYVSLEVSPYLAYDADGTVEEARRLWSKLKRANVMIKVPATPPGLGAIRQLIADGIPVNVTLIFSLAAHEAVMEAYIDGLKARAKKKLPVNVACVASFFISRLDTLVDRMIGFRIGAYLPKAFGSDAEPALGGDALYHRPAELTGKAGVASAKLAYSNFQRRFAQADFKKLAALGAKVQRPLWASTSTKNPLFPDTLYVEPLIGPDTVNTMPPATIAAFRDHGTVTANAVVADVDDARAVMADLSTLRIDIDAVCESLLEEGVHKFNQPFDRLLDALAAKRAAAVGFAADMQTEALSKETKAAVTATSAALLESRFTARLYGKDSSLYAGGSRDEELHSKILNRLGWLDAPGQFLQQAAEIQKFAAEVKKAGFKSIALLGMGGSSLCPEVCAHVFGPTAGYPQLVVLDTTEPATVLAARKSLDLRKTLFLPASKSGGTIETNSLYRYFWQELEAEGVKQPGQHFFAITDPGTALEKLAAEKKFRRTFINPPDIGGRFSALSYFGLVPMALAGIDVKKILSRAVDLAADGGQLLDPRSDAPVRLGITLAKLAQAGRDKMTLVLSKTVASLGTWIEQLVAESTGKAGHGILPVVGEPNLPPAKYASDRVFVSISVDGDAVDTKWLGQLEAAGHPVIRIRLNDRYDLGAEMLRWEIATAACGSVLGINPFDEPNVTESKNNTSAILAERDAKGRLPVPKVAARLGDAELWITPAYRSKTGVKATASGEDVLAKFSAAVSAGDFVGVLAYVPNQPAVAKRLASLQASLCKQAGAATTLGWGPRYLHSTGQHHKGGPNQGVFLVITHEPEADAAIPAVAYTFGELCRAQALGDYRSLELHGRRAVLVHLKGDAAKGLAAVERAVCGS